MPKSDKPRRTRLEKLPNSWSKASLAERQAFLDWVGHSTHPVSVPQQADINRASAISITTGRYLTTDAVQMIAARLRASGMKVSDLKEQLGLEPEDKSLARALGGRASLRLSVVARLEKWLSEEMPT